MNYFLIHLNLYVDDGDLKYINHWLLQEREISFMRCGYIYIYKEIPCFWKKKKDYNCYVYLLKKLIFLVIFVDNYFGWIFSFNHPFVPLIATRRWLLNLIFLIIWKNNTMFLNKIELYKHHHSWSIYKCIMFKRVHLKWLSTFSIQFFAG